MRDKGGEGGQILLYSSPKDEESKGKRMSDLVKRKGRIHPGCAQQVLELGGGEEGSASFDTLEGGRGRTLTRAHGGLEAGQFPRKYKAREL